MTKGEIVGCRLSLMPTTDVGVLVNIGMTVVVVTRHLDRYMLMMGVMVVMILMPWFWYSLAHKLKPMPMTMMLESAPLHIV